VNHKYLVVVKFQSAEIGSRRWELKEYQLSLV
jgi:hypothetical protein